MRFGFATILWGRRIDDLDYALNVIAKCGYQGVEIAQHHSQIFVREPSGKVRPLRDVEELFEKLRERNLELVGLVAGTLEDRMTFLGGHRTPYLYLDRWPSEPEFERQVTACLDGGFTIMLHPHWLMQIRKLRDAKDIIKRIASPKVRLLFDTAHAVIAEDDPVKFLEHDDCFAFLGAVHLKDWRPDYGRWSHRYAHGFCVPGGEGIVEPEKAMDVLAKKGFSGWVIFEQDHFAFRRESTALEGAQWMEKHGQRWGVSCKPDAEFIAACLRDIQHNPFMEMQEFDAMEFTLGKELSRTVAPCPDGPQFYSVVAKTLRDLFKAAAVKVWSPNPQTGEFCLLGMDAIDKALYSSQSIMRERLPDGGPTLAGQIVSFPNTCERDLHCPIVESSFADRDWLKLIRPHAKWMTVLPVFNTFNSLQLQFIITIFNKETLLSLDSNKGEAIEPTATVKRRFELERLGWMISHWADRMTGQICSAASGAINHLCGVFQGDTTGFINLLMSYLQQTFHCNSVTVFLKDMTGKRLEAAGNSNERITWKTSERYYSVGESKTGSAFTEREMIFSSTATEGSAREIRPPGDCRDEILLAPLVRRNGQCLGVVRLHNKCERPGMTASTMFTDEDAAKLDAVIQTALPYLELLILKESQTVGIARMIHEFQSPLVAIRGAVDAMRRDLRNNQRVWPDFFQRDFPELIVQWAAQVLRLTKNWQVFAAGKGSLPLKKQKTFLRSDVVVPVLHQIRGSLPKSYKIEFSYGRFDEIPPLLIDKGQFEQVFFNLISNSFKYGRETELVRIDINSYEKGDCYGITFSDWGAGIPEDIKEQIFLPEFRAKSAFLSDMQGQGLGLFVVRSIIEAHGGAIRVVHTGKPTTFEILLPKSLRFAPKQRRPDFRLNFQ